MDQEKGVQLAVEAFALAAKNLLPGSAVINEVIGLGLKALGGSGTDRFAAAMKEETEVAFFQTLPDVQRRVDALERHGARVNVNDFARVAAHFAKAWSGAADAKKRKLLQDAFVGSFDLDLYESGLLNALWERLDRLSYGDLRLLKELAEVALDAVGSVQRKHELSNGGAIGRFHGANLVREGLCWSLADAGDPGGAQITELGTRLYQLALAAEESRSA